jgi:hypothetical protein
VYDMYEWDRLATDDGSRPAVGTNRRSGATPVRTRQAPGVRAVQVALDRRDNGGDSSTARDQ